MNKTTIVLADNSYTIRRIVELSFSEEEIELISLENGLDIKEKLLELKPQVVLVDIKLPEVSGYEVCQFINDTPELSTTQVFLMKGGFEPVDESQLANLTYVDIITKPFDSNALVTTIKGVLGGETPAPPKAEPEAAVPPIPEDIPEIESFGDSSPSVDISFSDIKEEIESNDILETTDEPGSRPLQEEEILPSEEITQGSPQERHDPLSPQPASDDIDNPFMDETPAQNGEPSDSQVEMEIKENIKIQEQELEISSLTQEVINIKDQIAKQGEESIIDPSPQPASELQEPESEMEKELKEFVSEDADQDVPEFDAEPASESPADIEFPPEGPQTIEEGEPEMSEFQFKLEQAGAEISEELPDLSDIPSQPDLEAGPQVKEVEIDMPSEDGPITFEQPEDPAPQEEAAPEMPDFHDTPVPEPQAGEDLQTEETNELSPLDSQLPVEMPDLSQPDEEPKIEDTPTIESPVISQAHEPEFEVTTKQDEESELSSDHSVGMSPEDKEIIMHKVEDKLGLAVKEILWEIAPPLAEKIIKKEIEKLKSDIEQEYSD